MKLSREKLKQLVREELEENLDEAGFFSGLGAKIKNVFTGNKQSPVAQSKALQKKIDPTQQLKDVEQKSINYIKSNYINKFPKIFENLKMVALGGEGDRMPEMEINLQQIAQKNFLDSRGNSEKALEKFLKETVVELNKNNTNPRAELENLSRLIKQGIKAISDSLDTQTQTPSNLTVKEEYDYGQARTHAKQSGQENLLISDQESNILKQFYKIENMHSLGKENIKNLEKYPLFYAATFLNGFANDMYLLQSYLQLNAPNLLSDLRGGKVKHADVISDLSKIMKEAYSKKNVPYYLHTYLFYIKQISQLDRQEQERLARKQREDAEWDRLRASSASENPSRGTMAANLAHQAATRRVAHMGGQNRDLGLSGADFRVRENKMKLTHEKLKQIIKEELEEVRYDAMGFDKDKERNLGLGREDEPKPESEPSLSGAPPNAQKIFDIAGRLNDQEDPLGPLVMTLGNLLSSVERKQTNLLDHDLKRIKEIINDLMSNKPVQERKKR